MPAIPSTEKEKPTPKPVTIIYRVSIVLEVSGVRVLSSQVPIRKITPDTAIIDR
ncbi:hypothetical protein D3C75_1215010 [compost metagenome]